MFRFIRISLSTSSLRFRTFSLNGNEEKSYSQYASSSVLVMVSSAANRVSPLNLYGLLTLYGKLPSVQMLCFPRIYWNAFFAVQFDALEFPAIVPAVTSSNRIRSFRELIMCSVWNV